MGQSAGKTAQEASHPNTVSFTDLPVEILDEVFSNLSQKDQKAVNSTCSYFRLAVRPTLWNEPELTFQINWDDLKVFGNPRYPVKVLKLSQISPKLWPSLYELDESGQSIKLEELLDFIITNFKSLTKFRMDFKRQDCLQQRGKEGGCLTNHLYMRKLPLFKQFLRLPVTHIDSAVAFSGYFDYFDLSENVIDTNAYPYYMLVSDFIEEILLKAEHCTSIFIDENLHAMLSLEHWQQLVGLPITEIRANFQRRPNDFDFVEYLTEYDNVLGRLSSSPKYKLVYRRKKVKRLRPSSIQRFCHVRIAEMDLGAISSEIPLKDYAQALRQNEQTPLVFLHGIAFLYDISIAGFTCLAEQCPFGAIDTATMCLLHSNIDSFVDLVIASHQRSPIRQFVIDSQHKNLFKRSHRKKLQCVGL